MLACLQTLAFETDFALKFIRNDYAHAFVGYFECAFTQIHKPIVFSTSPHARYTHWKQTVFYLQDELTVCAGEELKGRIKCVPNSRNHRDLDIDINYIFSGKNCEETDRSQKFYLR